MASTAASLSPGAVPAARADLSLRRLYVLRATYLLIAIGEGSIMVPVLFNHAPMDRGVIPSLLSGMCILDLLGVRYPRQMLPLLLFEFAWKLIWMLAFGMPQFLSGETPPTFTDDFPAILFGVVLMPLVIPWSFVWRHYARAAGDRWR